VLKDPKESQVLKDPKELQVLKAHKDPAEPTKIYTLQVQ
jgi:hypothetical protein